MSAEVEKQTRGRRNRRIAPEAEAEAVDVTDVVENRGITAPKGRATRSRRNIEQAEETGNAVTRAGGGVVEYIQGVRSELDKVVWPTRPEVLRLMRIVVSALILSAVVLGVLDLGFNQLFASGIENPVLFLIFFAVVGVVIFIAFRVRKNQQASTGFSSRL